MKAKLEAVGNVTVIVVALAVGYVVLKGRATGPPISRSVAVGDRLARVPGIDWGRHRRTLVLALNSGCHYCQDSVPFYQELAQAQKPGVNDPEIVAVFPNDSEAVQHLLKDEGLAIRAVAAVPVEKLGIVGFPTLLLVDREGRVERSWVGLLTPRQELEVLKVVSGSMQDCSADRLPALQIGGSKSCDSGTNTKTKTKEGR
jgi:thiol-disulfide isomerase/thioredoxin